MFNNVRQRSCLQLLRPRNPFSLLERPSYATAYLELARSSFTDARAPLPSTPPSTELRSFKIENLGSEYCLILSTAIYESTLGGTWRTKGITAHLSTITPLDRRKAFVEPYLTCRRAFHAGSKRKTKFTLKKGKSFSSAGKNETNSKVDKYILQQNGSTQSPKPLITPEEAPQKPSPADAPKNEAPKYLHMPKIPHRPTKEEVLAAATGFWSELKLRFKWFSIRSARPWNADDISAFVSWIFVGHIVWIFVGTTTFFSIVIFTINTVVAQETLARWVGDYLTQSAGVKVVFESAIVPKWGDGVISFRNVFVSRRPGQGKSKVSKGSSLAAAVAAEKQAVLVGTSEEEEVEDTNYSQFDVTIDSVNVTLSLAKWWNGKGLLRDVEVKGVRGIIDRTSVHWGGGVDPRSYKHKHQPGDFEIDYFKLEDLLVTIHQPGSFRPFSVSIYSCELPQLRKQWLFYDFISANTMSGSFDGSLFTIHPHQTHGFVGSQANNDEDSTSPDPWKKHSRLRIDGLKIDHLNRGVEGPFSWIQEGNVDIVADVMFPADNDDSIGKVMSNFYDRLEATVTSNRYLHILDKHSAVADLDSPEKKAAFGAERRQFTDNDKRYLVMDLRVNLNDVRASIPLFTPDLSYVNNALVRPIVAYINSQKTFIPINCRVVKRVSEFDGSWTIFDSGLMDDLSAETYEAFAKDVQDSQARIRRLRKVGLWSLSWAIHALLIGLAGTSASGLR